LVTYLETAFKGKIGEDYYKNTQEYIILNEVNDVINKTFTSQVQIKKFFKLQSQYNYRSKSVKKKITPVKTGEQYTYKNGNTRQLYVMADELYVKIMNIKQGNLNIQNLNAPNKKTYISTKIHGS
jgi:hypothetical protein